MTPKLLEEFVRLISVVLSDLLKVGLMMNRYREMNRYRDIYHQPIQSSKTLQIWHSPRRTHPRPHCCWYTGQKLVGKVTVGSRIDPRKSYELSSTAGDGKKTARFF